MLCQVVLLFHFLSSCFFFYFGGSELEHSTLQNSRREVSMGLGQKGAPHGQTTCISVQWGFRGTAEKLRGMLAPASPSTRVPLCRRLPGKGQKSTQGTSRRAS